MVKPIKTMIKIYGSIWSVNLAATLRTIRWVSNKTSSSNTKISIKTENTEESIPSNLTNIPVQDSSNNNEDSSDTDQEKNYPELLDENYGKIQDKLVDIRNKHKDMMKEIGKNDELVYRQNLLQEKDARKNEDLDRFLQRHDTTGNMSTEAEQIRINFEQDHINKQVEFINKTSYKIEETIKELDVLKKDLYDLRDHRSTLSDVRLLEIKGLEGNLTDEGEIKLNELKNIEAEQARLEAAKENISDESNNLSSEKGKGKEKENVADVSEGSLSHKRPLDETESGPNKRPSLIDDFANPALEMPSYIDPDDG